MRRKTNQKYLKQLHDRWGNEYVLLTPYQSQMKKVKVKHIKCGHVYWVYPMNLVRGHACKFCQNRSLKSSEQFKKQLFSLFGDRYKPLDPYKGANKKIRILCNKCHHILYRTPSSFINSRKECGYCSMRLDRLNSMSKKLSDAVGTKYQLLDYAPSHHKNRREYELILLHKRCGTIFRVTPSHFFSEGTRCPRCSTSHGEETISNWLRKNHIKYIPQMVFKKCRNKAELPFDFYLPSINMCIEYDGEQHYDPNSFYNKKRGFEYRRRNDEIKTNFCKQNDIKLLRIRYDDDLIKKLEQAI